MMAKEAKPQNRSAIAERFIALRRRLGFSQSRLGKMIGICRQSVSKIENEHVLARDSTWHQFCEYAEIRQLSERMAGLPESYWRDCLTEDESAEKGDIFRMAPLRRT
jgi:DNA-binding XRE family transcriptional regulator